MTRECDRFLRALDHGDSSAFSDPHPGACAECSIELNAARVLRGLLSHPASVEPPRSFAARVAYLARVEAAEQAARARRARRSVAPEFVWLAAGTAALASVVLAVPILRENYEVMSRAFTVKIALPGQAATVAAAVLSFTSALAIDLARRARPAH